MKYYNLLRIFSGMLMLLLLLPEGHTQTCKCNGTDYPGQRKTNEVFMCVIDEGNEGLAKYKFNSRGFVFSGSNAILKYKMPDLPQIVKEKLLNGYPKLVDFGDGNGYRTWQEGQVYSIQYSFTGSSTTKYVKVKIKLRYLKKENINSYVTDDEEEIQVLLKKGVSNAIEADEIFTVGNSVPYTPVPGNFPAGSKYNSQATGTALVSIKYGNKDGDKELRKPLLIVEGLDFGTDEVLNESGQVIRYGDVGLDILARGADESFVPENGNSGTPVIPEVFAGMPAVLKALQTPEDVKVGDEQIPLIEYDLIFVDFKEGAGYIQANAGILMGIIEEINNRMQAQGGICSDIVVLGASMGGQIARYALAKMEEQGLEHNCRAYVSFDSPHQGASISLALQAMAWFTAKLAIAEGDDECTKNESLQLYNKLFLSPAPRQLLVDNLFSAYEQGKVQITLKAKQEGPFLSETFTSLNIPNYMEPGVNFSALRNAYQSEMNTLGYPKKCMNIGIACGSLSGFKISGLEESDLFSQIIGSLDLPAPWNPLDERVLDLKLNALPGEFYSSSEDQFSATNVIFYGKKPVHYISFLGNAVPDRYIICAVNAIGFNGNNYDNCPGATRPDYRTSIEPAFKEVVQSLEGTSFLELQTYTPQDFFSFIPTVSALDVKDADLNENVRNYLRAYPQKTPFKFFFGPDQNNEQHVASFNGIIKSSKEALSRTDADLLTLYREIPLQNKTIYNFGLFRNRLPGVTVKEGGVLRVNNTGLTGFLNEETGQQSEFHLYTRACGNTTRIKAGGTFILGDDSGGKTGVLHISAGRVIVESNGILRLNGTSKVLVEKDGILEIGADAVLELFHHDATIHIKKGGKLVVHGEFKFNGNGFIQFDPGHILEQKGVFAFSGAGKNNRHIRLNNCVLTLGTQGLRLSDVLIEYQKESVLRIDNSSVKLDAVTLKGTEWFKEGPTGIQSSGSSVYCRNTSFLGLEKGIEDGNSSVQVYASDFNEVSEAIYSLESSYVFVQTSTFNGVGQKYALYAHGVPKVVMEYSVVQDYRQLHQPAITLIDVSSFSMRGGVVDNCQKGIQVPHIGPDYNSTKVFLSQKATLSNNFIGLEVVNGGNVAGYVQLDCAEIIYNQTGIKGSNILLDADACNIAGDPTCTNIRPNYFARIFGSTQLILDICQVQRTMKDLMIRGNHWDGISSNAQGKPAPLNPGELTVRTATASSPASCRTIVNLIVLPIANPAQVSCTIYPDTEDPDPDPDPGLAGGVPPLDRFSGTLNECKFETMDWGYKVDRQYRNAWIYQRTGNEVKAEGAFLPLAHMTDTWRDTASQVCKHYVDVARVMVGSRPADLKTSTKLNRLDWEAASIYPITSPSEISGPWLQPNPTTGATVLRGLPGQTFVRVFDVSGKKIFESIASNMLILPAEDWEVGVFWVKLITPGNEQLPVLMMIKQ